MSIISCWKALSQRLMHYLFNERLPCQEPYVEPMGKFGRWSQHTWKANILQWGEWATGKSPLKHCSRNVYFTCKHVSEWAVTYVCMYYVLLSQIKYLVMQNFDSGKIDKFDILLVCNSSKFYHWKFSSSKSLYICKKDPIHQIS